MSKEYAKDSLGERMKSYEALSTSRQLMPNCPVYARLDGRAFHTLCKGLKKPYSIAFIDTMQDVCKYLVDKTGAILGYVQSDEISLGWVDYSKAPFEGRIQKLESVLASMASAKFVQYVESSKSGGLHMNDGINKLWDRCNMYLPTFDCRVFNLPSLAELANAFLWRENDAIKNSINGMAQYFFSHKALQGKCGEEMIAMMKEKGYDFYRDTEPSFMRGTFYHKELYDKELTKEDVEKIPEKGRENLQHIVETDSSGKVIREGWFTIRSHVAEMKLPYRLTDTVDVEKVLFYRITPECNKDNPTFRLEIKEKK